MSIEEQIKAQLVAHPIGYDVFLKIEANGLGVMTCPLDHLGLRGRAGHEEVLTFLYQDRIDLDNPDEERPVRRARIVVEDLGTVEQGEQS